MEKELEKVKISYILSIKSMNFMQFCNQKGTFSTLNLQFAYFVQSKMSVKGIIMFLGMNNTRLERKILIILDFGNGFLPTYLPQCNVLFDPFEKSNSFL